MKANKTMLSGCAVVALAAMAAFPAPAFAQANSPANTDDTTASNDGGFEEILVIGRKRSRAEELQKTPLAVTALNAAQLQTPVLKDLVDIGRTAPNAALQTSAQRGVQNFAIRGMGVSGTTPSDEPAVGVFQDGVYWGSNYGALSDAFDLEGVEILRGPQGTLFGRNVTGGAVTVRSARPTEETSARFMLGAGNGAMLEASAVVNGGIGQGLAARLAVLSRHTEGLYTNVTTNSSYGKNSTYIVRPSVKWTPTDTLDITLLGEYLKMDGDPAVARGVSPTTVPGGPPTAAQLAGYTSPDDFWATNPNEPGFNRVDVYFGMLEANLDIGPGTLTSISGYRDVSSSNLYDPDGFPLTSFHQFVENEQHQFSSELRYAADLSNWLAGTVGAYYFDQKFKYRERRDLSGGSTVLAAAATLSNSSYAFFGEFDIKPIEDLSITVGGRYTHEEKDPTSAAFGACTVDFATCTFQTAPTYQNNNFSPKIGLSYQATPDLLLFGSFTKGFRSGGYSLRGTALGAPYQPEKVSSYEAGIKSDLLNRHLRINLTGFYAEYKNLQRTVIGVDPILGVVQSVFNAADAHIEGLEAEVTARPVAGLTVGAVYGYTRARYESFLGSSDPGSLRFVRVPAHTGSVNIDWEHELESAAKIRAHAGATYTGQYYFNDANTPTLEQKGYTLVDASLTYTTPDNVSVTLYSRNLLDKEYTVWGSTLGALGQNVFLGEPRTYGVRLTVGL